MAIRPYNRPWSLHGRGGDLQARDLSPSGARRLRPWRPPHSRRGVGAYRHTPADRGRADGVYRGFHAAVLPTRRGVGAYHYTPAGRPTRVYHRPPQCPACPAPPPPTARPTTVGRMAIRPYIPRVVLLYGRAAPLSRARESRLDCRSAAERDQSAWVGGEGPPIPHSAPAR